MKKAIILVLLLLSLEKEELDDFMELMNLIQNKDGRVIQALENLYNELNKLEQ